MQFRCVSEQRPKLHALPRTALHALPLARAMVSTATGQDRGQHCHPKTDVPERARATFLCTSHWREQRIQASIRR
jgi:hypothetical protein